MNGFEDIAYEEAGGIAHIRLARPGRLNAMRRQTMLEVPIAVTRAEASGQRVILLSGEGRGFCAGLDFDEALGKADPQLDAIVKEAFNPMILSLRRSPLPVVNAVQGASVGGGVGLALAGDIVIAARSAFFSAPFGTLGLCPDGGTSWFLPEMLGRARATGMLMLGERIDAARLLAWGLVWDVVEDDDLLDAARAVAARLIAADATALTDAKRLVARTSEADLAGQLDREAALQGVAGRRPHFQDEIARFMARSARRSRAEDSKPS